MKYYIKQPVEAIQWTGDNLNEVYDFIIKTAKSCCAKDDYSDLIIAYEDCRGRKFKTVIPLFGWVVREGNTFQLYKDETFRHTFKAAEEVYDESAGIDWEAMDKNINDFFDTFDKDKLFRGFHGISKEKIQDAINKKASEDEGLKEVLDKSFEDMAHSKIMVDCFGAPTINVRRDVIDAIKEEARAANIRNRAQSLADFLQRGCISREEAEKHLVGGVTFDSVIDEMKELHAKKNKDYGDAFHKSFVEFGPTAGVVRLNDKMERVKSLVKNGKAEVKDESLLDTLKDMSSYAVMLYVELKNRDNGKL